jgi:hypothetical protein
MSFFIRHAGECFSNIALANHLRQKGLAGRTPEDVHAVVLSLAAKLDDSLDLEVFLQYTRGGWIYHA